jgi:hypothetical protein
MTPPADTKPTNTVGQLLRARLKETKRTVEELAAAVDLPTHYVDELIAGTRRPPSPERTDIYARMTTFLRLGRQEMVLRARAERAETNGRTASTKPTVRKQLLELCEPATARRLEQRRAKSGSAEIAGLCERLLSVAQGSVRRLLDDQVALRLAAAERATTYLELRFRVLEFLDATPATVSLGALDEFVTPRVRRWDVDFDTGVLRVVLRTQEPRRRPQGSALGRSARRVS